uniref:Transmembrane protein n=1 Tax=Helianthus annuus TaxID=4232 RepID=A0A251VAX9_HELAN
MESRTKMGGKWSRIWFIMILLLITSFSHIQGQPNTTTTQTEGRDDTVRPDPLENLKKYRGGYDVTNVHYWSSTAYTGIAGYVLGALWLLCGVVFGAFLVVTTCCKANKKLKRHKKPTFHKQYYLWHILIAAFFTLLALVGTSLVLGGNAKFHSRADKIIDIIIDTADDASTTIYNTTGAMNMTRANLQGTNVDASTTRFLESTSRQLDSTADDIQRQARKNRHKIDLGLRILYIVSTVIFALNLVAVIALTAVGVVKIRRVLHILIVLCWLITVLCWVFFGAYFFLSRFAGDTCTALEGFQQDPYNNSLSSILPCDQLLSAESVLNDVSAGVYNLVNEVNANLSRIQQDSSFGVCNPFSGPPEYNYQPNNCSEDEIRIGDIPELLKLITCVDPVDGICNGGIPVSGNDFRTVVAYTSSIQILLNTYPGMESLLQCQTVKDAFSEIIENHCTPVKRDVKIVWAGLVFLSIVMVFLVLTWTVESYYERNHRFSDGSVKPHHADDMIELGKPEEKESVNSNQ